MSVVLVCFPNAPKVSEEAVKREAELDKFLEARVEGKRRHLFIYQSVFCIVYPALWKWLSCNSNSPNTKTLASTMWFENALCVSAV